MFARHRGPQSRGKARVPQVPASPETGPSAPVDMGNPFLCPFETLRLAGTLAARSRTHDEIPLLCRPCRCRKHCRARSTLNPFPTQHRAARRHRDAHARADADAARYRRHHARGPRLVGRALARRGTAAPRRRRDPRTRRRGTTAEPLPARRGQRADARPRRRAARRQRHSGHHRDRAHPARAHRARGSGEGTALEPLRRGRDRRRDPDLHAPQGRAVSFRHRGLRHR